MVFCSDCGQDNPKSQETCASCGATLMASFSSSTYQVNASEIVAYLEAYRHRGGQPTGGDSEDGTQSGYGTETTEIDVLAEVFLSPFRDILKGFRIEGKLGKGGMGVVMAATQLNLNRKVAMKFLPRLRFRVTEVFDRFKREAKTLARLDNPYVVPIYELFESKGHLCIVMGYAEGGSVRQLLKREGRLNEEHAAALAQQTALGLWSASREGIVHRDIKPGNLLLDKNGRIRIADFGLAKQLDESQRLTHDGSILGTPAYISPEQWNGTTTPDHRSDLYSLGCTLFEMLTGRPPFETRARHQVIKQHILDTPPDVRESRPEISDGLAAIVARLLEKDPDKRFQTGVELAEALESFAMPWKRRQLSSDELPLPVPLTETPSGTLAVAAAPQSSFLAGTRNAWLPVLLLIAFLAADRMFGRVERAETRQDNGSLAIAFDMKTSAERAAERWQRLQQNTHPDETSDSLAAHSLLEEGFSLMKSGEFAQAISTYIEAEQLFGDAIEQLWEQRFATLEDTLQTTTQTAPILELEASAD